MPQEYDVFHRKVFGAPDGTSMDTQLLQIGHHKTVPDALQLRQRESRDLTYFYSYLNMGYPNWVLNHLSHLATRLRRNTAILQRKLLRIGCRLTALLAALGIRHADQV